MSYMVVVKNGGWFGDLEDAALELEEAVNELLDQGWRISGGVTTSLGVWGQIYIAQALVRE